MKLKDNFFSSEEFLSASTEELRALLVLQSKGKLSPKELSEYASISLARARGALALWEACGIFGGTIEDVYEVRQRTDEVCQEDRREVAKTIQREELETLLDVVASLLGKPTLNDLEVRIVTGLYSQYGISEEYICTLLSDIVSRPTRPTVKKLEAEAIRHFSEGIDTVEGLTEFFHRRDSIDEGEREVRRTLSIARPLSKTEKEIAHRWVKEYGYGEDMILQAYDFATASTQNPSLKYLDKILSAWHQDGIKTVADAIRYHEEHKGTKTQKKKKKEETPRYGNFDPEEAFLRALERSYGEETGDK